MRRYDEIMEKIKVTPEMRQRVLEHIAREGIAPVLSKAARRSAIRKYFAAAACFTLLLAGAAAVPRLLGHIETEPPLQQAIPNIAEAESAEALSKLVGFAVTEEFSLPFEVKETAYFSYWNEMAEIDYSGEESSAVYRQSRGRDDNSGDYNAYNDITEITIKNENVTLKGNDGMYSLAIWTDGTYSYSLSVSSGASRESWHTMLS